jgi:hypothetical protein
LNRYSVLFAVMVAASFALQSGTSHESAPEQGTMPLAVSHNMAHRVDRSASSVRAAASPNQSGNKLSQKLVDPEAATREDALKFLREFLEKSSLHNPTQLKLMFATLPDPIETHLASAFDHDVSALQDGIEDSNYVFDSSWIPWEASSSYDTLADTVIEQDVHDKEKDFPGILLFRKVTQPDAGMAGSGYDAGMIVILLAEKPTAGISIQQTRHAIELLSGIQYPFAGPLRILGPTFSGSLPSLVSLVDVLRRVYTNPEDCPLKVLIRSGGITGDRTAQDILFKLASIGDLSIDLGSAEHSDEGQFNLILRKLGDWGIKPTQIAVLTETESSFGREILRSRADPWKIGFPRDISALRTTYERQGILERVPPAGTSRPFLQLQAEDEREGDSIKEFGDQQTVAAQESVLFGIAGFLKTHDIRVVAIVATSEADRYFLSQFIHANVSGVRVVIVGSTRLFLRGSTSQFWGDLMVSSFPLLPQLYEWTGGESFGNPAYRRPRILPDDSSQGSYIATRDLWAEETVGDPTTLSGVKSASTSGDPKGTNDSLKPFPGYGHLLWSEQSDAPADFPPVYLSALGAGSVWPVESDLDCVVSTEITADPCPPPSDKPSPRPAPPKDLNGPGFLLRMPFPFARHFISDVQLKPIEGGQVPSIEVGRYWEFLYWILIALTTIYCFGMLYANPVVRTTFAYLYPRPSWRSWTLLVALPCLTCQFGFLAMIRSDSYPFYRIPGSHRPWWWVAVLSSVAMPLLMLSVSRFKLREERRRLTTLQDELKGEESCTPDETNNQARVADIHSAYTDGSNRLASVLVIVPAVATILFVLLVNSEGVSGILNTYREMHWESALSLVPSALLLLLAVLCWTYQTAVGINLLEPRPHLPRFVADARISDDRADTITSAGTPFPTYRAAQLYWWICGAYIATMLLSWVVWTPFRNVSTLESRAITWTVLGVAAGASVLMFMDLIQFLWLWAELRGLLGALNRQKFRRSFVPIRDFSWRNIWSFSGGSFHERRKVLAVQVECLFNLVTNYPKLDIQKYSEEFKCRRAKYSRRDLSTISVEEYQVDLLRAYWVLGEIGTVIAAKYTEKISAASPRRAEESTAQVIVNCSENKDGVFEEESRAVAKLPPEIRDYECFLCLLYVGFIQCILSRLRTLAISVVSIFSLIALAFAIYPFRPIQPLTLMSLILFIAIAISIFVVFSQMDKDPILGRILQSDPTKLEWSFYGKFLETLAPPLLTLLSSLLPGGAGRLLLVMQSLLGHGQ